MPVWMRAPLSADDPKHDSVVPERVELPESLAQLDERTIFDEDEDEEGLLLGDDGDLDEIDHFVDGRPVSNARDSSGLIVIVTTVCSAALGTLLHTAPLPIVVLVILADAYFVFRILRSRSGILLFAGGGAVCSGLIVLLFSHFGGCADDDPTQCVEQNVGMCDPHKVESIAADFRNKCCLLCKRAGAHTIPKP